MERIALVIAVLIHAGRCESYKSEPLLPVDLNPDKCPSGFEEHPLLLISTDGFRADYINRDLTPTIEELGLRGVRAPFVKPSYPSITFPNHYTIVTGLMPGYHGIIANTMWDPVFKARFRIGKPESLKKRWWYGEPIWKTAEKQGKIAATYFWPGAEVEGLQPTWWLPYNKSHHFKDRVDTILSLLDLERAKRPDFLTLYLHEPDEAGHDYGPDSPELNFALVEVDHIIRRLIEGLKKRNILSCINIILMADHGMAEAGKERVIKIEDYIPHVSQNALYFNGVFGRIQPNDSQEASRKSIIDSLSCKRPEMRVYRKEELPVRWHMSTQRRLEDIVFDLDVGYQVDFDGTYKADVGDHGYDNIYARMNALFVAHGPDLRRNLEVESFQNTEVYNLMCQLLGLYPAPNNGTFGALNHLLTKPSMLGRIKKERLPIIAHWDVSSDESPEDSMEFSYDTTSREDSEDLIEQHAPWGLPQLGKMRRSARLLLQPDHITVFSNKAMTPLYTSFTVRAVHTRQKAFKHEWVLDSRVQHNEDDHNDDDDYDEANGMPEAPTYFEWQPLFSPGFSHRKRDHLAFLGSNAVLVSEALSERLKELQRTIFNWMRVYKTINIVTGPVFDHNADSYADEINRDGSPPVSSHIFLVLTRCLGKGGGGGLASCPGDRLDTLSFIFPQKESSNCLDSSKYAREHLAKLQDVEKITGFPFYPNLRTEDRIRLQTRVHSDVWLKENWENRLRSDLFGLKK